MRETLPSTPVRRPNRVWSRETAGTRSKSSPSSAARSGGNTHHSLAVSNRANTGRFTLPTRHGTATRRVWGILPQPDPAECSG
jgi:hypothetical protein